MREIITSNRVPASTSPVSLATRGGGLVFVGGQMPRDTISGQIVEGGLEQARLSLAHGIEILGAAGSGPDKVMLATVYMTDLCHKDAVNTAFAEMFGDAPPARNLVEVSAIGETALVEIALIALA